LEVGSRSVLVSDAFQVVIVELSRNCSISSAWPRLCGINVGLPASKVFENCKSSQFDQEI